MGESSAAQPKNFNDSSDPIFRRPWLSCSYPGRSESSDRFRPQVVLCTYFLGRDVEGIPTERTVMIPWYNKLSAGPSWHKFYIDVLLLSKVLRACRNFRPDIIHAHLHEGILIGKIASLIFRVPLSRIFRVVSRMSSSLTSSYQILSRL